ncbi:MAG: primosomal protein N' [Candidatus Saccharimonas sp.]|nr:primosomal protein N' [Candidatus Saccharimonas sp.]
MYYYEVAPLSIVRAEHASFTYHTTVLLDIGTFVLVPVGKKSLTGIIIKETTQPSYPTKPLADILDIPVLPKQLVTTASWMSDYYATHFATVLQTVLPRGITKKRRAHAAYPHSHRRDRTHFLFNNEQSHAIDLLSRIDTGGAILHGVTGSGKTAVYIELARRTLSSGKSVIVLVPEIALTPQLVADFQQHFTHIFLTHSKQTEAQRHLIWLDVAASTEPCIVIGPRSALFMPIKKLGLIVIDESHEPSYKQDQSPRYAAQRVASVLAVQHDAKVIQGSATPLVTEYYLATHTHRPIVAMPSRAQHNAIEPTITLIDMTKRHNFSRHRFISDQLLTEIEKNLTKHTQSLIFHNRRGSASTTLCESCGWSAMCGHCFIPLTLHADRHRLECHVCAHKESVPTSCPICASTEIIHKGIGTKLIESEFQKIFPTATIARFDGDTSDDTAVDKRYQALYDGSVDIIIGTQVIAKGLDLPHLRTVGVIQADAGLALPDFTASERTFQLLAQVIGRVGRTRHATSVIVQSYRPDDPSVHYGITQDFTSFYNHTLSQRKKGLFPPFTYLLKLTCIYKTEAAAVRNATALAAKLRQHATHVQILGPTPAFYERQHDSYRWQLIVKSPSRVSLVELIQHVPPTHWQIDLDPSSLL